MAYHCHRKAADKRLDNLHTPQSGEHVQQKRYPKQGAWTTNREHGEQKAQLKLLRSAISICNRDDIWGQERVPSAAANNSAATN
jgi:hypothetical protein